MSSCATDHILILLAGLGFAASATKQPEEELTKIIGFAEEQGRFGQLELAKIAACAECAS